MYENDFRTKTEYYDVFENFFKKKKYKINFGYILIHVNMYVCM